MNFKKSFLVIFAICLIPFMLIGCNSENSESSEERSFDSIVANLGEDYTVVATNDNVEAVGEGIYKANINTSLGVESYYYDEGNKTINIAGLHPFPENSTIEDAEIQVIKDKLIALYGQYDEESTEDNNDPLYGWRDDSYKHHEFKWKEVKDNVTLRLLYDEEYGANTTLSIVWTLLSDSPAANGSIDEITEELLSDYISIPSTIFILQNKYPDHFPMSYDDKVITEVNLDLSGIDISVIDNTLLGYSEYKAPLEISVDVDALCKLKNKSNNTGGNSAVYKGIVDVKVITKEFADSLLESGLTEKDILGYSD